MRRLNRAKLGKYRNVPTVVDNIRFASKREASRYGALKMSEHVGGISELVCQPRFALHVDGTRIGHYVADFAYMEDGEQIIEDVKSPATAKNPLYRWKIKHLKAEHGIDVKEIY